MSTPPSIHWTLSSVCPKERSLVGRSSPFMRFAQHLTALRTWYKQCVPGRWKPDVLRPGIVGMREFMVIPLRSCMIMSTEYPSAWYLTSEVAISWACSDECCSTDATFFFRWTGATSECLPHFHHRVLATRIRVALCFTQNQNLHETISLAYVG